jgi:hypothetical protein
MAVMLTNFALTGVLLIVSHVYSLLKLPHTKIIQCLLLAGCTAERVFRVDSGQEHLHYITDISNDCLYILDPVSSLDVDNVG